MENYLLKEGHCPADVINDIWNYHRKTPKEECR
jgi:hypothetical protein